MLSVQHSIGKHSTKQAMGCEAGKRRIFLSAHCGHRGSLLCGDRERLHGSRSVGGPKVPNGGRRCHRQACRSARCRMPETRSGIRLIQKRVSRDADRLDPGNSLQWLRGLGSSAEHPGAPAQWLLAVRPCHSELVSNTAACVMSCWDEGKQATCVDDTPSHFAKTHLIA